MSGNTDTGKVSFLSDSIDTDSAYGRNTGFVVTKLNKAVLKKTLQENDDPLFPVFSSLKTSFTGQEVWCILHKQIKQKHFTLAQGQLVADNTKLVYYTVMSADDSLHGEISKNSTVCLDDLELSRIFYFLEGEEGYRLAQECFNRVVSDQGVAVDEVCKRCRVVPPCMPMEPPAQASPPLLSSPGGDATPPMLQMFKRSTSDDNVSSLRTRCTSVEAMYSPRPIRPQTVAPEMLGQRFLY